MHALAALLVVSAISTGCLGGKSPDVQYYTFETLAQPPTTQPVGPHGEFAIAVGPLQLPSYLEQQQIVTRTDRVRLHYDDFHRWAGRLDTAALHTIGQNLGVLLASQRIVTYPRQAPFPVDFRLDIAFDRFDADQPGDAVLRARFSLQPGSGGDAVTVQIVELREPVKPGDFVDLARAHSALLSQLSTRIAAEIVAQDEPGD